MFFIAYAGANCSRDRRHRHPGRSDLSAHVLSVVWIGQDRDAHDQAAACWQEPGRPIQRRQEENAPRHYDGTGERCGDDAFYIFYAGQNRAGCGLVVKKGTSVFEVRVYGFDLAQAKTVSKTLAKEAAAKF